MTELYYISKYYKDFINKRYINYNDEILNNIFKNYDVNKHNKKNDKKFFTLLTQKLSRELSEYLTEYLIMVYETNNIFNFKDEEETLNNANEYCRLIQKVLMEENEIYKKIVLLSNKYKIDVPLITTPDKLTKEEMIYTIEV